MNIFGNIEKIPCVEVGIESRNGFEGRNGTTKDVEKSKNRFGHFGRAEFWVDIIELFVLAGRNILLARMGNKEVSAFFLAR